MLTVFQETPSIWISPSVFSSLKNAKSKVLFPEPVLPKRPTCNANYKSKHLILLTIKARTLTDLSSGDQSK